MKKDNWILKSFLMTFFIAIIFSSASNFLISKFNNTILLIVVCVIFIGIGILFDIVGTAVLTANEASFHAKSAKKIKGSKERQEILKLKEQYALKKNKKPIILTEEQRKSRDELFKIIGIIQ